MASAAPEESTYEEWLRKHMRRVRENRRDDRTSRARGHNKSKTVSARIGRWGAITIVGLAMLVNMPLVLVAGGVGYLAYRSGVASPAQYFRDHAKARRTWEAQQALAQQQPDPAVNQARGRTQGRALGSNQLVRSAQGPQLRQVRAINGAGTESHLSTYELNAVRGAAIARYAVTRKQAQENPSAVIEALDALDKMTPAQQQSWSTAVGVRDIAVSLRKPVAVDSKQDEAKKELAVAFLSAEKAHPGGLAAAGGLDPKTVGDVGAARSAGAALDGHSPQDMKSGDAGLSDKTAAAINAATGHASELRADPHRAASIGKPSARGAGRSGMGVGKGSMGLSGGGRGLR